jgi:hypothetical protein
VDCWGDTDQHTGGATAIKESTRRSAMIKRSLPNGRTDVIKVMGNTKWDDLELKASLLVPVPPLSH